MKLRIKGDNIRLRLSQNDIDGLLTERELSSITQINRSISFSCSIHCINHSSSFINWESHDLSISVPYDLVHKWAKSEEEGLYFTFDNNKDGLNIAIEKDFPCKHPKSNSNENDLSSLSPKTDLA